MKNYKLALSDEILMQVEKPARYIGNEVNAINKSKDPNVDIRFAMCFPDVYENSPISFSSSRCFSSLNLPLELYQFNCA